MEIIAKRTIYGSNWVSLHHIDVRLRDGQVMRDWHLIDFPQQAAGIVPLGDDGRILMIDQFRFTTGRRTWETPGGRLDANENPLEAARRELREETGHAAETMEFLGPYYPSSGSSNQVFNIFLARGVKKVGEITDTNEVLGARWFTPDDVRKMINNHEIIDGMTLTGLLWVFDRLRQ